MGATLLYGLDVNNNKVFIDNIKHGQMYYCPGCKCPLIARRGEVRVHHFAHHFASNHSMCAFQFYDLSEVATVIEKKFSDKGYNVEVIFDLSENKKLIANTIVGEYAILVRDNAKFKEDKVEEETNYFKSLGMKVIYYVNLKNEVSRADIEVIEENDSYIEIKWKKASHRFLQNYSAKLHDYAIFFDMSKNQDEKIIPLSHYVLGRSTYAFNEKYDFSVDDFVDYCLKKKEKDLKLGNISVDIPSYDTVYKNTSYIGRSEGNSSGLDYSKYSFDPTGCEYYGPSKLSTNDTYIEKKQNEVSKNIINNTSNGKTIWELCSKEYESIVVSNVFSNSTRLTTKYLIKLKDGRPEIKNGKIVGKATWKDCNGEHHFGSERTFYDSNEKNWRLDYANKKSDSQNKRETITNISSEKTSNNKRLVNGQHAINQIVEEVSENEELEYQQDNLKDDDYANALTLTQAAFECLTEGKKKFYAKYIPLNKRTMLYENGKVYEINPNGLKGIEAPEWVQKDINEKKWLKDD